MNSQLEPRQSLANWLYHLFSAGCLTWEPTARWPATHAIRSYLELIPLIFPFPVKTRAFIHLPWSHHSNLFCICRSFIICWRQWLYSTSMGHVKVSPFMRIIWPWESCNKCQSVAGRHCTCICKLGLNNQGKISLGFAPNRRLAGRTYFL